MFILTKYESTEEQHFKQSQWADCNICFDDGRLTSDVFGPLCSAF
jgi:hypothetical protein